MGWGMGRPVCGHPYEKEPGREGIPRSRFDKMVTDIRTTGNYSVEGVLSPSGTVR